LDGVIPIKTMAATGIIKIRKDKSII